jgi:hypothetical protein
MKAMAQHNGEIYFAIHQKILTLWRRSKIAK